ncbi:PREDICTED: uncharacterized protein LOC106106009 isoform X3 [Papilio polytes]|uniref:uncharacterized protein LOC106106009 isoform X3 n=1 Tax=Papilio polytes TaxID=76194 RepID=UPI0006764759|nr:PREDICTED: uncharacterized protein LOC106106009 isoform X3 [Papilio polytes]
MNFDDYARQLTLKYQVAIATAVIKSKPNNLTIQEYIIRLKNINKMDFDSDITVCSDDFKFDDDIEVMDDRITFNGEDLNDSQATNISVNLLEGYNMENNLEDNKKTSITNLTNIDNQINKITKYKIL